MPLSLQEGSVLPIESAEASLHLIAVSSPNSTFLLAPVREADRISYITFGGTGDSAKTDVFRKLMNEKRAGGVLSGGGGSGVIEDLSEESKAGYTELLRSLLPPLISFSFHGTDRL